MPSMTKVKCKTCGSGFEARTADVNRGWGKFCSKSCKAVKQARSKSPRKARKLPTPDGRTPMKYKVCQTCGDPAVNGVYSPFGRDNGIEWACEVHMDTTHPFESENFNNE